MVGFHTYQIGLICTVTSQPGTDHFLGPLHHHNTILSILDLPFPHGFWVTYPGSALASFSLNFGVLTEPEASELPKCLVLGRDGNMHLKITPLGDARRPHWHIFGQGLALIPFVTSRPGADHFPGPFHHHSTILSALGLPLPHGFWVTHPGSALASFSLNFGIPTKPEASELPKGLVLGRDENIHLRITSLGDVGCYMHSKTPVYKANLMKFSTILPNIT
ncbi:hypothetical protein DVH24_009294 [Malus domestica]|uniref:Uncharacterized protein n=1 Tax=Malus domestica TaxID=3750 RepID=A0A498IVQ4_MALDO|nr:hypothetical protein DVH24_009294 [Malus domestica]